MTAGLIYSCKWMHGFGNPTYCGWEMLMFLGTRTINRSDGITITNYRFYDILQGETRLLDETLIKYCKEINLEET